MLAFDRHGQGPDLLLLHGTTSSRRIWSPLLPALAARSTVWAIDLPGHGESPPSSLTPPQWAAELSVFLDQHGIDDPAVIGHSAGGWTALELAKQGRVSNLLALAPAGLWRKHSPLATDLALNLNWRLGRAAGPRAVGVLRSPTIRSLALRTISADPRRIPAEVAVQNARGAIATDSFPRHFTETRRLRFQGGQGIEAPIRVIWGDRDRIALPRKSRSVAELPPHAEVETWSHCGHMMMWDAPERVLAAARDLQPAQVAARR